MKRTRNLIIVLGDQLDRHSAAFDDFSTQEDAVWMAEVTAEAKYVWSHKVRIALFLSAMRHFAQDLEAEQYGIRYRRLDDPKNQGEFAGELRTAIGELKPQKVIVVEPGEWRVEQLVKEVSKTTGVELEIRPDRHFLCSRAEFSAWADKHKSLRMEFFYRDMRKKTHLLMDGKQPVGGRWNYDTENRKTFGKRGPDAVAKPKTFAPDRISQEVIDLVNNRFAHHPGELTHFDFPVTPKEATLALKDFIKHRLPVFGTYQDAMWQGEHLLFHSRLSAMMNLKLLDPREVIDQAQRAYEHGEAPLAGVEGFIRQILGWREYVRGVYWHYMPDYEHKNALQAEEPLPDFYWTAKTDMNCLHQTIGDTLKFGYAHHIQRLMVTGLYALLLGVKPVEVHKWYLAIYYDAVEWVEMPNTIGMSQFGDGGIMGSKPYVASGKYIDRMSNYCGSCKYKPAESIGEKACPFTTLYWDFLLRHEGKLKSNHRMDFQFRNLVRMTDEKKQAIRKQAESIRSQSTTDPSQAELALS